MFAQIYLLDLGERLGTSITKYREKYFTYNRWSMKWKLRDGCEEEILEKIKDICLVMKVEDYLDLEKPVFVERKITLSDDQMALYEAMKKDFMVTLPDGTEIEAGDGCQLSQKLLQMASGVLYETYFDDDVDTEDMKKVKKVHHIHDHKIEALRDSRRSAGVRQDAARGLPLQVVAGPLEEGVPEGDGDGQGGSLREALNAGKIPMLLIHPQSGGHGLNMQHGGHNLVFFDIPWSLELFLQLIGRLARQGQKNLRRGATPTGSRHLGRVRLRGAQREN